MRNKSENEDAKEARDAIEEKKMSGAELAKKYNNVDASCIDQIHHSTAPKFKTGDVVTLITGESPNIVIEKHIPKPLRNAFGIKTFNGYYVGHYYTMVKKTDINGNSTEVIEPKEIELHQDMYRLVQIS
jgi:hypothetical protein